MSAHRPHGPPPDPRLLDIRPKPLSVRALPASTDAATRPERRDRHAREALLKRVRREFEEMPGLRLTRRQAERLFGLRGDICARILATLVTDGLLVRSADGAYARRIAS